MGRKIPVRKHRGVRDPEKQRQEREAKLKNKVNHPPTQNGDEQPLPQRALELMRLRDLVKEGKYVIKKKTKKKKKKGPPDDTNAEGLRLISTREFMGGTEFQERGMKRPEKMLPIVEQRPFENDRTYLYRVQQMCDEVMKETVFEDKYGVQVERNEGTGLVEGLKRKSVDEVDEMLKEEVRKAKEAQNPKKRKKTHAKLAREAAEKEAREEKRKLKKNWRKKKQEKIEKKKMEKADRKTDNVVREVVKFGDIVHRPPELKVLPRKAANEKVLSNLMFNQMLLEGKRKEAEAAKETKATKQIQEGKVKKIVGKSEMTGKRKDLPPAQRQMLELQQQKAVAAYRLLKAKRGKTPEA